MSLPQATHVGLVRLRVADLERALAFYRDVLGLVVRSHEEHSVWLEAPGAARPIVRLDEHAGLKPKPNRATGLFHVALLLSGRLELARALSRLIEVRWPLQGASDHAVSEAIYVADPDGNGMEIYADRPRPRWRYTNGELYMTTEPLAIADVLSELAGTDRSRRGLEADAIVGHVHLQVRDLARAESFYAGVLGLDVTVRSYPGALFLSAGGYHHHVAVNIWAGRDAPPAPADSAGLEEFELRVGASEALAAIERRGRESGTVVEVGSDWCRLADPDANVVVIRE